MTFFQRGRASSKSSERARSAITFFTVVTFAAGFLTLALLPTPYLIERAGPTYDVLGEVDNEPVIQISGAQSYESEGTLEVLTVSIVGRPDNTPNWIEIAFAWLDESQAVVPVELLYPDDRTTEEIRSESSAMMEVSQQDAIAAALNYLGYETPRQVYIAEVVADAAASGKLVAGDFVLSINSEPIEDLEQLKGIVTSWDEEAPLSVVVDRNGREVTKEVSPIKDAEGNFAGEIAWSDVFNVIRDTHGVRKMGDARLDLTLNGLPSDVKLTVREFPVLGAVKLVDGDTGELL